MSQYFDDSPLLFNITYETFVVPNYQKALGQHKKIMIFVEDSDPDDNLLVIPSKHLAFINNFCYDTNTE